MGLAVSVGYLADMKQHDEEGYEWAKKTFAEVNEVLESEGLQGWEEPEEIPGLRMRPHVGSFPYGCLHHLRRAYAYATEYPDDEVKPTGEDGYTDEDDSIVQDAMTLFSSHLLCHSDCEGLYVPVEFPNPIFSDDVPGAMLGSSHALLDELREVAPHIGIRLEEGELPDAEAKRLYDATRDGSHPWDREYMVFLTLWETASASVRHATAIVFS